MSNASYLRKFIMRPVYVTAFTYGLMDRLEGRDAPRGSATDCLNWHFLGDHIELRRGRTLLGSDVPGVGRVSGLRVGRRFDGTQYVFYSYARKFLYYDPSLDSATEISTDILPVAVLNSNGIGEDVSIEQYNSLSGNSLYWSSPNSSIYKTVVANPGSITNLQSNTYRGKIRIKNSRTFLFDRKDDFGGSDKTGLYVSHVDATSNVYAYTSKENLGTGDGVTKTFSGTLAFKAGNAKEACFFVVIAGAKAAALTITTITKATAAQITSAGHGLSIGDTVIISGVVGMTEINGLIGVVGSIVDANNFTVNIDSTDFTAYSSGGTASKSERFIDDRSGNFTSQDGGTGTINYTTGVYTLNFNTDPLATTTIYAQYFREDPTRDVAGVMDAPSDGGILDFGSSVPRLIGEGAVFRQDDGGGSLMAVETLGPSEYCLHEFKSWILTLGSPDDTVGTTNLIFRDNVGIPYHRAAKATGLGIFYIDVLGENPMVRVLNYAKFVNQVLPQAISEQLNLNFYNFNKAVMFEWSDYIILSCQSKNNTINDRIFMYNKVYKTWEVHSYRTSCFDILNGALIAGDSGSNNIFKLFSGLSDEDSVIDNYFITNDDQLNKEGEKTSNIMRMAGLIGISQGLKVSYSVDYEPFVEIKASDGSSPLIKGTGSYVDTAQRKLIGALTMGEEQIGGGQDPANMIYASPYLLEFHVGTKRFDRIRLKLEATAIGYVSVSEYGYVDIRNKSSKQPVKYRGGLV